MKDISINHNSAFFRQLLFIGILILIALIIFFKLSYLLSSVLGAITIYVVLRRPLFFLTEKKKWKPWLTSLMLVSITVLVLLALAFVAVEIIAAQIPTVNISNIMDELLILANQINDYIGIPIISKNLIIESKGFLTNIASGLVNSTYNFALNLLMMIFILYFMLANGRKFESTLLRYSPFEGESLHLIKIEVKNMIYSNAIGIPVIMLAQGIVSALGYWIIGLDRVVFWAFLTALCGLVPVVGTAVIWLPVGIVMFATGQIWQGIFIVLYSIIVITNTDNACRLVLMKVMADTHPLIVIFGVILGIPLFGFWGIIFGPLLISGFLLLIKIYYMEYHGVGCTPSLPKRRKIKSEELNTKNE